MKFGASIDVEYHAVINITRTTVFFAIMVASFVFEDLLSRSFRTKLIDDRKGALLTRLTKTKPGATKENVRKLFSQESKLYI